MSFARVVTSLMGGVGCLGMGSVAIGHKALGVSELPERPDQQRHEVRASSQIKRLFHIPCSNDNTNRDPHARTVPHSSYSRSATLLCTALTMVELRFSLELQVKEAMARACLGCCR